MGPAHRLPLGSRSPCSRGLGRGWFSYVEVAIDSRRQALYSGESSESLERRWRLLRLVKTGVVVDVQERR